VNRFIKRKIECKGKVVLCLTERHAMGTDGEWRRGSTRSWPRRWMGVGGRLRAPVALPPWREPPVPIGWGLGGPRSRSRRGGGGKGSRPPPGIGKKIKFAIYKFEFSLQIEAFKENIFYEFFPGLLVQSSIPNIPFP
jgi:hypothetical protein